MISHGFPMDMIYKSTVGFQIHFQNLLEGKNGTSAMDT